MLLPFSFKEEIGWDDGNVRWTLYVLGGWGFAWDFYTFLDTSPWIWKILRRIWSGDVYTKVDCRELPNPPGPEVLKVQTRQERLPNKILSGITRFSLTITGWQDLRYMFLVAFHDTKDQPNHLLLDLSYFFVGQNAKAKGESTDVCFLVVVVVVVVFALGDCVTMSIPLHP